MRINAISAYHGDLKCKRLNRQSNISHTLQERPDEQKQSEAVSFKGLMKVIFGTAAAVAGGFVGFCAAGPIGAIAGASVCGKMAADGTTEPGDNDNDDYHDDGSESSVPYYYT